MKLRNNPPLSCELSMQAGVTSKETGQLENILEAAISNWNREAEKTLLKTRYGLGRLFDSDIEVLLYRDDEILSRDLYDLFTEVGVKSHEKKLRGIENSGRNHISIPFWYRKKGVRTRIHMNVSIVELSPQRLIDELDKDSEIFWFLTQILSHELGHAMGLGHPDYENSVMYPKCAVPAPVSQVDVQNVEMLISENNFGGSLALWEKYKKEALAEVGIGA